MTTRGASGVARRALLAILGTGLGSFAFLRSGRRGAVESALAPSPPRDPAIAKLLGGLAQRSSMSRVGLRYLETVTDEADAEVLIQRMCSPASRRWLAQAEPNAVGEWLRSQLREDFALGRTVRVDGWVLSATEARLCALVTLWRDDRLST